MLVFIIVRRLRLMPLLQVVPVLRLTYFRITVCGTRPVDPRPENWRRLNQPEQKMKTLIRTKLTFRLKFFALVFGMAASVQAHEYYAASFKIIHPWALPTGQGDTNAKVFVRFEEISKSDKLVSASSPIAERVDIVSAAKSALVKSDPVKKVPTESTISEPAKPPVNIKSIDLPAGSTIDLQSDEIYLKMVNLKMPLQPTRSYPMTLVFENSGAITVQISVGAH